MKVDRVDEKPTCRGEPRRGVDRWQPILRRELHNLVAGISHGAASITASASGRSRTVAVSDVEKSPRVRTLHGLQLETQALASRLRFFPVQGGRGLARVPQSGHAVGHRHDLTFEIVPI